ncbi:hypothetical protein OIU84_003195 [Salix udensis]|uniref:Biogenesis of lysosome-related organelles complex 1 subunit 7 n=1 Tax=Salix udensis TaxID=889485 RepID=A0AAD6K816_9ROSI|nr:hypothetical protein OIU84_003195 [Salix udensis]
MDPSVSTGENTGSNENNSQESESESESNNNRSDALGKALSTMLANVIKDFDSKAQDTLNSQDKLNSAIDRLTRELDQLLEDAPLPPTAICGHASGEDNYGQLIATLVQVLKAQREEHSRKQNYSPLVHNIVDHLDEFDTRAPNCFVTGNRYSNLKLLSAEDFTGIALRILCGADMQFKTSSLPAFILDQKALYGN